MKVAVRAEVIYLHGNASCRIAACELLRHSQPSATHAFGMHNEVKDLAIACWALLLKEQKGGGQSGPSRVVQPSTVTTCHWPGSVWERAKGQTQVLEAEPSMASRRVAPRRHFKAVEAAPALRYHGLLHGLLRRRSSIAPVKGSPLGAH